MNKRDGAREYEFQDFELVQNALEKVIKDNKNQPTKAAKALGTFQSTVSRIRTGDRKMVSDEILARLGLRKRFVVVFESVKP